MLAKPDHSRRNAVRPSRSLRNEHAEFLQLRIEDYKNQLSREELLRLADEAVREMDPGDAGQLALTEILVTEHVDRLIAARLNLPRLARWKSRYSGLRLAQRQATRWDIEPDSPITHLVLRLEPGELTLVIGKACARYGFYIAAHDSPVLFVANDLTAVEHAERRAGLEALASRFEALAVDFQGPWFPEVAAALVVLDPRSLIDLPPEVRLSFIATIGERTLPGGMHYIPFDQTGGDGAPLEAAQLRGLYGDWIVREPETGGGGLVATKKG